MVCPADSITSQCVHRSWAYCTHNKVIGNNQQKPDMPVRAINQVTHNVLFDGLVSLGVRVVVVNYAANVSILVSFCLSRVTGFMLLQCAGLLP